MKVAHNNKTAGSSPDDQLAAAREIEQAGDIDKAVAIYEKVLKDNPRSEEAYNRLMIIYRKSRDYKKELATIKKGISAFEQSFKASARVKATKKISTLSRSLLKSLGLADKKGNPLLEREPVGRWKKRQAVVERLIKRKTRN